jgi:queuosine precursor transporter
MKIYKIDFLVALYTTCLCLAEIMSMKVFPLVELFERQFNASVGIFVFPVLFVINDVITEVKGEKRAKGLVYSSLMMVGIVMVFSLFAVALPSSARFRDQGAYSIIFGRTARICFASLVAFLVSGLLDVAIFTKLKKSMGGRMLWFRGNVSNIISQLIDTVVFISLAHYSFQDAVGGNIVFLFSIILPYWLLKCFMSLLQTPFTYWGVNWLKAE